MIGIPLPSQFLADTLTALLAGGTVAAMVMVAIGAFALQQAWQARTRALHRPAAPVYQLRPAAAQQRSAG